MLFYFDSHCLSAEEYSSLSVSSAASLFTFLTLNAAKFSIPFGRVKRQSQAWWSAEAKDAVSKTHKTFAAAYRSDGNDLCSRAKCPEKSLSAFCFFLLPRWISYDCHKPLLVHCHWPRQTHLSILEHLPRSGMVFFLHIFNFSWSLYSFPSISKTFSIIFIHNMGKLLDCPASFWPISDSPASQIFLNASFYLV